MATAEAATRPHDRANRRRPFSSWVKRLTNITHNSSSDSPNKKRHGPIISKAKKAASKNNPYPQSGHLHRPPAASIASGHLSFATAPSRDDNDVDVGSDEVSLDGNGSHRGVKARSNRSTAPTLATTAETVHSDTGYSKAGNSVITAGGALSAQSGGGNSTFSSPQQSDHSLTTTLTTIQSTAPSNLLAPGHPNGANNSPNGAAVPYSSWTTSPPPSAIPPHLSPHPQSSNNANILTDNASIMTLASSSKRRRRHSLDTDASIRALAPQSLYGSRESLPLSVLSGSQPIPESGGGMYSSSSHNRPSLGGIASAERASVYSNTEKRAGLEATSERNSYCANKQGASSAGGEGGSIRSMRSGFLGHSGRTDSISGSVGGTGGGAGPSSPLASPREPRMSTSRRNSDWRDGDGMSDVGDDEDLTEKQSGHSAPTSKEHIVDGNGVTQDMPKEEAINGHAQPDAAVRSE